jgi:hypothetical protein
MKKKKYLVTYSVMGGGTIEVKAHSRSEAEHLFWSTSDNKISKATDLGGLQIEYMEIEDPYQVFDFFGGDYLDDEDKDGEKEEDEDEDEEGDEKSEKD